MRDSYHGVTALITGASKGLGREYALELARRGARATGAFNRRLRLHKIVDLA